MDILKQLAEEFKIRNTQVENTVKLIDDGNTIPFISRYRKEMTGGLDDQLLRELSERLTYLRNLESRKEEVKSLIESGGNLTDKITQDLLNAKTLAEVEDIYRPFKPKRKTRAGIAKEKGLQPLADFILAQTLASPTAEAEKYISEEKGVETVDDAINGALDIISETVSDDADLRKKLYAEYTGHALIVSKATDEKAETVYKNYYDYSELACKIPPHRLLALDRGEREDALKVSIEPEEQYVMKHIYRAYVKAENDCGRLVRSACDDSFKRLIHPSLERRLRNELTEKACDSSIHTFSDNLRQLLMQPPVKNIVTYREENGVFTNRKELLKVSKLGKKAYEQCAGFMRIHGGKYPLDNTSVHPESYKAAEALLEKCGFKLADVSGGIPSIKEQVRAIGVKKLSDELGIGEMTLADITNELAKPGRDPRDELPPPLLRTDVADINSLKPGMILDGTVRNVIDFGVFVDIGVHQDGLVHISQICDKYIKHPLEVVKVGDIVKVKVLDIDPAKKRISLTMKGV